MINRRKWVAIGFTILSGVIVSSWIPMFNEVFISVVNYPKYQQLDHAIEKLSSFDVYQFKDGNQTCGLIESTELGFNYMLQIIQKRSSLPIPKNEIKLIYVMESGTGIKIAGMWSNPQFVLVVASQGSYPVTILYENEIKNWVVEEKTSDLQNASFVLLFLAIVFELLSDESFNDIIPKIKKKITPNKNEKTPKQTQLHSPE